MRIDDTANVDQAKTSFAGTEKVDYEDWNPRAITGYLVSA